MTDPRIVLPVTAGIIVLSAAFVIIEFALLGARRNRLEEDAVTSRGARAAIRGMNELTLMLAGAQLGITAATFALGAITKPAFDAWLSAPLESIGLPYWLADGSSFVVSLVLVTFLHLVVGEMAPKSWAIAHPETAAIAIGVPARALVWPVRPLLRWINRMANRLVRASGIEPVEHAAIGGQDAATIRQLVEHSADVGTLSPSIQSSLTGALELETLRVADLLRGASPPTSVPAGATGADVQRACERSGHMRIVIDDGTGRPLVVHVRDTLLAPTDTPAVDLARPAFTLPPQLLVHEAMTRMRRASEQLAVVMDAGRILGVVTVNDALRRIMAGYSH